MQQAQGPAKSRLIHEQGFEYQQLTGTGQRVAAQDMQLGGV